MVYEKIATLLIHSIGYALWWTDDEIEEQEVINGNCDRRGDSVFFVTKIDT